MLGKRDSKKVLAVMLVLLTVACVSVFAAPEAPKSADSLKLIVQHIATYVFGYVLGGLLLIKFGFDLVQAFWKRDQDPAAIKKAVIGFVFAIAVVLLWKPLIELFLGYADSNDVTGVSDFLDGLGVDTTKIGTGTQTPSTGG